MISSADGSEENSNGATQTGSLPNLLPSFLSWVGDPIIPARSASRAVSGE